MKPKGSLETSNILRSMLKNRKMNVPSFDGRVESYDKWEIEWAAFAEEEGLSGALGDCW